MSVSINQWRACIGSFNGGRGGLVNKIPTGTARGSKQYGSGIFVGAGLLLALVTLLFSPIWILSCGSYAHLPGYSSSSNHHGEVYKIQFNTNTHKSRTGQPCLVQMIISDSPGLNDSPRINKTVKPRISRKKLNKLVRAVTGNRSNRGIKLAHWNAGSAHLHNKLDDLMDVVSDLHPHVLGVSEANFRREHSLDDVQIPEYDLVLSKTVKNDQLRVSRVVCYKHQSMVGKVREDLMDDNFSSIWLELGLPRKRRFLVCQLYREWQYLEQSDNSSRNVPAQLLRWSIFLNQWERALDSGKEVIVMGDFNLDYFKFSNSGQLQPLVDKLVEQIYPHGVQQVVQGPTHSWPGKTDSCIDLIYTNRPEKVGKAQAQIRGSSDHRLVLVSKHSKSVGESIRYVRKRSYKNFDEQAFRAAVQNISWFDVYSCQDVDLAVEKFTTKLTEILDIMAPVKTYQVRTKYAAWVSDSTKERIRERDAAQSKAAKTQLREDWNIFKKLRNDLAAVKKKEKFAWQQKKLESCEETGDHGQLWKRVLGWLSWSSTSSPTQLYQDGVVVTSPVKMAELQNKYYIDKVRTIRQNMPAQKNDPLNSLRQRMHGKSQPFSLGPVSPDQIEKIISNLKNSKASGLDMVDTYILKLVKPCIVPAVCHIVNLSFQTCKFPSKWKIAKVIPLYKGKGCKLDPKSYRPVALLPILSKVLERSLFIQVMRHMESNKFLNPNHHAYRSGHSTTTALLQMHDTWLEALEGGDMVGVCMLDMSAAFDLVDTNLLLKKLNLYGFDENSVQWTRSYLTHRSQGVYIDGAMSSLLALEAGVPQGSILGPLFYTIFTNELPQVIHEHDCPVHQQGIDTSVFTMQCLHCGGVCCYPDDSTYSVRGKDPRELSDKLTKKYNVMADYLTDNKLKVNDDKTHLLVMTTRQRRRYVDTRSVSIVTPTTTISPSNVEKLLGIHIHHDMRWAEHVMNNNESLVKALSKRLAALKKISQVASFRTRKTIANGIFMSKLIYVMPLWSGCEEYLVKSLQVVQNKAARVVARLNIFTPTKELMMVCGWLSVRQLLVYHSLVLLYRTVQMQMPLYLYSKVKAGGDYTYRTRQAATFPPGFSFGVSHPTDSGSIRPGSYPKLDMTKQSWSSKSVEIFNTLPSTLRLEKKLVNFKTRLKEWIKLNVPI